MSGATEFDPDDTSAQPMRIREQAQGFARVGGQLTGRQDSLAFVLNSLAASFSEVLHPLIGDQIGDQFYTLQDAVGAMLYAERVTNGWADDVVAFQQQRDVLIETWESAEANGFWITRAPGYDNVEPEMRETLYDDARRRVLRELNADADAAFSVLAVAAQDRGRQFSEGPTVDNLLGLMSGGLPGGPGLAILYPYLPVTGPRYGLPRQYWGRTPEQLIRATEDDPELAALLVARRPDLESSDPFEAALAAAALIGGADLPGGSAYGAASAEQVAEVARVLAGIPAEELALLAALFPGVVGHLNGMPFEHRIAANRVRIADALHQARADHAQAVVQAQTYGPPPVGSEGGYDPAVEAARVRALDLENRIGQYEDLLSETTVDFGHPAGPPWPDHRGHKLLYFDPGGDGSWAELVGSINTETESVGVLVPGVGTDTMAMDNTSAIASEFVAQAARDGEQLAMIVWAGGDFPDNVISSLYEDRALDMTGPLTDFSNALQQEIDAQGSGSEVPVTVIGHSYGGVTVAMSTLSGLSADRLLFVNSPGLGPGSTSLAVYGELERYETYAMAAPGDPVPELGPLVHGSSPMSLDMITLDTGVYRDGTEISGPAGHGGVFEESSTAWENILAVLTGGRVVLD